MGLFTKKINITELFPKGFVDIHSHLLPGIDDGAKNIENTIELIDQLYKQGVKNFRITPHVLGDVWENSSATIKEKETEVKKALSKKGYNDVNIHAAAEYMLDKNFEKLLENNDILALKDNYILVEMSYFNAPYNLDELLFQIQLKGYIPVLAHPERYNFYHGNFKQYEKLINAGCLFQLNLLSLTEQYGKPITKTAYELLKKGMYTYVGTDTHHTGHLNILPKIATQKTKNFCCLCLKTI